MNETRFDKTVSVESTSSNEAAYLANDLETNESEAVELNLSSINVEGDGTNSSGAPTADASAYTSRDPDALFTDTAARLEEGTISVEPGINLLMKAGNDGSSRAFVYLGKLYSDETKEIYNPAMAFEYFEKAAKKDSGDGYYNLALCYNEGLGCEKAPIRAYEYLLKGAEIGSPECICALGICREFGIGCNIDYAAAVEFYSKAAEMNNVTAICNLGGCYLHGHGIPQNQEKAIELFKKAAAMGSEVANCRLGVCYETGEGCEPNHKSAFICYRSAAAKGNPVALYRLAVCYANGIGTDQNLSRAFKYFDRAAEEGNAVAMYASAMMSKLGKGTKKDPAAAYKMFSLSAEFGHPRAHYELGNCHFEGIGTVKNYESAFEQYNLAYEFDNKNADAAFKIGLCKLKGLGTSKNTNDAFEWFCKGAERGSAAAAYMKGECFYYGVGITQELSVAARCFEKAISYAKDIEEAAPAIIAFAKCLEYGNGVDADPNRAFKLYVQAAESSSAVALYNAGRLMIGLGAKYSVQPRTFILRAARMGYVPAMLLMGIIASEGKLIPKNSSDAGAWYERVVAAELPKLPTLYDFPERFFEDADICSGASVEGRYRLGMLLIANDPSAEDCIKAFDNIAMAASLSHKEAKLEIARFHMHGGTLKHYFSPEVFENARSIVPNDFAIGNAMNSLGDSYFDGKIFNKNPPAAARCYKIAAEVGNIDAAYSYGWCLRHGSGVAENDTESLKWLKLAADRGNVHAAYSYGLCCEEGAGTGIINLREARSYYRKAAAAGHVEAGKRYMALAAE